MPDDTAGQWCVQTRRGPGVLPAERWVDDVDAYIATLNGPAQYRFTHASSKYIDRFRDLDSTDLYAPTGVRYTEFGWQPVPTAAGT